LRRDETWPALGDHVDFLLLDDLHEDPGIKMFHQHAGPGQSQPDQKMVVEGGSMVERTGDEGDLPFLVLSGQELC
jgi:hypothetical protein